MRKSARRQRNGRPGRQDGGMRDDGRDVRLPERDRGPLRVLLSRLGIAALLVLLVSLITYLDRGRLPGRRRRPDRRARRALLRRGLRHLDGLRRHHAGHRRRAAGQRLRRDARGRAVPRHPGRRRRSRCSPSAPAPTTARSSGGRPCATTSSSAATASRGRRRSPRCWPRTARRPSIVVIDARPDVVEEATRRGFAGVVADASAQAALEAAGIREAAAVVVAPDRDDTATLITLTARELNPRARIVASVRQEENAHLLEQGGADSVVVSSGAAGRLLGHAVHSPRVVQVLEDLLSRGSGLDIIERAVEARDSRQAARRRAHGGAGDRRRARGPRAALRRRAGRRRSRPATGWSASAATRTDRARRVSGSGRACGRRGGRGLDDDRARAAQVEARAGEDVARARVDEAVDEVLGERRGRPARGSRRAARARRGAGRRRRRRGRSGARRGRGRRSCARTRPPCGRERSAMPTRGAPGFAIAVVAQHGEQRADEPVGAPAPPGPVRRSRACPSRR